MEFIKQNIEWLFSGAGIYILGVIVTIILLILGIRNIKFRIKFEGHITNKK
jgi:hypothetical protein